MPKNMPARHPEAEAKGLLCGSCQWFSAGFSGNNCQKKREVEITTQACIEYTIILKDYLFEAAKDKYIIGIRDSLKDRRFTMSETLLDELKGYMINIGDRPFDYGSKQDMTELLEALRKIVSYRARVSSIYTTALELQYDLEEMTRHLTMWLSAKYQVYRDLKNEQMRASAIDRLIPELISVQRTLGKVRSTAKYLDERLDANDWTLKAILSSSEKLWFSREGGNRGGVRN